MWEAKTLGELGLPVNQACTLTTQTLSRTNSNVHIKLRCGYLANTVAHFLNSMGAKENAWINESSWMCLD